MNRSWVGIALLGLLLSAACDGRTDLDASVGDDAGQDGGAALDAGIDAGPRTCADQLAERRVSLDPDGPLTQIHPSAVFDGEGIWVVYVRPEPGGGNFDVWATRRGCDGAVLVAPFLVQADPAGNDIDPAIARSGDQLLVAWNTDDGTGGTDNLQVRYRVMDLDGTLHGDRDETLRTVRMGTPITDNHLGADVAATSTGFVVAGARAVPDVMRFQAYAQRLDRSGALVGEALEPLLEPMVTQSNAAIGVAADDGLFLAYDRAPDDTTAPTQVMLSRLDGSAPELALEGLEASGGADVLVDGDATWVAMSGDDGAQIDLRIFDASEPLATRVFRTLGEAGAVDHSPQLARSGDGAVAVAWFRQIRGFSNELLVASVTDPASTPATVDSPVPSYAPAITHVMNDWWFVSYAIGDSPDFRLVGRFVQLP
ncbi:MAG: hypothetical protein KC619_07890 [Myxococcales bacterium]|nr:hypothetical protein [Myxococcales bacterium]